MNKPEALTLEEFRQLRELLKEEATNGGRTEVRDRAIIELLFTLTLRVSDFLDLKVKDLVKENGEVKKAITMTESKNKNHKGIFVRPKPEQALRDWLSLAGLERSNYLFPSPYTDDHISRQQVDNIIKKYVKRIDLEKDNKVVSSHSGRKTMGRRLWKNGVNMQEIRKILGHTNEETTRKYIGIFNKDLQESVMSLPD